MGKRRNRRTQHILGTALVLAIGFNFGCSEDAPAPNKGSSSAQAKPSKDLTPKTVEPAPSPVVAEPEPVVEETRTQEEIIEAGRAVYMGNCIACHNIDATKEGVLGPAVAGSSLELIEARVLRSEYPEGYTPKRDTKVMIALRHLEPNLKELTIYLDSLN